jgi:hypothetical protein
VTRLERAERLERTYRWLLYAYPAGWRRTRGEELVGVLLLAAQAEGRRRPNVGDAVDLVVAGLRTRAEAALRPVPVLLRERVAMLGLVSGAALSVLCLVRGELPWPTQVTPTLQEWPAMPHLGPFLSTAIVLYVSWLGTLAAAVSGSAVAFGRARALLAVTTVGVLVSNGLGRLQPLPVAPLHLVVLLAALAALTFLDRTPVRPPGRREVLFGSGGLAVLLFVLASVFPVDGGWWTDPSARPYQRWAFYRAWGTGIQLLSQRIWLLVLLALVAAALVSRRRHGWAAATAIICLPWTWFALLFIDNRNTASIRVSLLVMATVGLVLAITLVAFHAGARRAASPTTSSERRAHDG